jgi:hypothetical protein
MRAKTRLKVSGVVVHIQYDVNRWVFTGSPQYKNKLRISKNGLSLLFILTPSFYCQFGQVLTKYDQNQIFKIKCIMLSEA